MKARISVFIFCVSLMAAAALAHGGEEHVLGTVTKVAQDSITVKTAKSVVTVAVVPATTFTKGKLAAKITDLNVGDRVVIHAKESAEGKLVADTVQLAAPLAQQTKPRS